MVSKNNIELYRILNKQNLNDYEKDELLNIIYFIYEHDEFQRRMTSVFAHHGEITLGSHIIEDTVVTYILSKKYLNKNQTYNYNLNAAVKISMLHNLYTVHWQNNPNAKTNSFLHKHSYRHPIESVINANSWYPNIFDNEDEAKILIDGIVHHMFPAPVISFNDTLENQTELKNFELVGKLNNDVKQILVKSSNRNKIGSLSFSKSIYPEGIIMSNADKKVSFSQFKDIDSVVALVTGYNKKLQRKNR